MPTALELEDTCALEHYVMAVTKDTVIDGATHAAAEPTLQQYVRFAAMRAHALGRDDGGRATHTRRAGVFRQVADSIQSGQCKHTGKPYTDGCVGAVMRRAMNSYLRV
jgi:hypothetical protein